MLNSIYTNAIKHGKHRVLRSEGLSCSLRDLTDIDPPAGADSDRGVEVQHERTYFELPDVRALLAGWSGAVFARGSQTYTTWCTSWPVHCHPVASVCICGGTNMVSLNKPLLRSWHYSFAHCPGHHCSDSDREQICPPQPSYSDSNGDLILVDCCSAADQSRFTFCPEPPDAYPQCGSAYRPTQAHVNLTTTGILQAAAR